MLVHEREGMGRAHDIPGHVQRDHSPGGSRALSALRRLGMSFYAYNPLVEACSLESMTGVPRQGRSF